MKAKFLVLLALVVVLSGCAVTMTSFEELQDRVTNLENRPAPEPAVQQEPVAQTPSINQEQIDEIAKQLQHALSQIVAMDKRLITVENKLNELEKRPVTVVEKAAEPVITKEPEETPVNVTEYYNEGRRLFESNDYPGAIRVFKSIIENYNNDSLAGPAQYWIGESYYSLTDFSAAKTEFEKVVNNYPSSTKFIDAQFKIALCYLNQNQKDKAKSELNRIKRTYPKYEYMDKVNSYLNRL
ncbi:MAG TPA: tol-pal system protein YbgF [Candidatus Cloacimonadota bacterium]|nr:tol-pal system protein YbgF [Candidatus Cloacimonadota bacterium]HOQ81396.1 tol-pal system protein YbgF [Candidatus Cloacimonadota bacterium]